MKINFIHRVWRNVARPYRPICWLRCTPLWLLAVAWLGSAAATRASDPIGIYALLDRVVVEPNEKDPERIQLWGVFEIAEGFGYTYGAPQRGYMYFHLSSSKPDVSRVEWKDLKRLAGSRQVVGFGSRYRSKGRVRKASDSIAAPEEYPVGFGLQKMRESDYEPVRDLLAAAGAAPTAPSGEDNSAAQLKSAARSHGHDANGALGRPREFHALFTKEGVPEGWIVRDWADVRNPPPAGATWKVEHGILTGSNPRGTWLISEAEYANFVLDFDFKLGERGNSGVGLRFPLQGDPAYDGMEIQMVDPRYYGEERVGPAELTGSIYKAVAPAEQLYRPTEWNHYRITCDGPLVKVVLNGQRILNVNLDHESKPLERGPSLKERPRRGHLGFQELSRGGTQIQIRNARILLLD